MHAMKLRNLLITALLTAGCAGVSAQNAEDYKSDGKFSDNMYIDAGVGVQTIFAHGWKDIPIGRRITPSFTLGIGKMFSPYWGLHMDVYGYNAHGYRCESLGDQEPFGALNEVDVDEKGRFRYYMRHVGIRGDFRFNLVNLIAGNANKRVYELTGIVGMGYKHMIAYRGTTDEDLMTAHFGLRNSFRVSNRLDINLDVISEVYDNYMNPGGKKYVADLAVNAGVSFYIGKRTHRKPVITVPLEMVRYKTDTVLVREVPSEEKVQVIKTVKAERLNMVMASIRFKLNRTNPIANQEQQLVEVARFLKKNPEAKVRIEGYADATTGYKELNERLSRERAERIYDMLVETYEVNKNQLEKKAMDLDTQPYSGEPEWNCVTLIRLIK